MNWEVEQVDLVAGTQYRELAGTWHRNMDELLIVKISFVIILVLIRIHVPTMGAASAGPTTSSTLPTTMVANII